MNSFFAHPYLLLFLVVLPLAYWYYKTKSKISGVLVSTTALGTQNVKTKFRPYLFVLKLAAIGCFIIALARPRTAEKSTYTDASNGIDIVLSIDVSASMLAKDLKPNRLEAVKEVASNFVKDRVQDRLGLVVYAGESYTKIPITSDKVLVSYAISEINYDGFVLEDGTAIGIGLATAINRIKDSKAKSKVIILMTDGVSTKGSLDPISAAEIAKEYGIKVYTIGVGTDGFAEFPVSKDPFGNLIFQQQKVEIDEAVLQQIAASTNGKYYRATDNNSLAGIYKEIDQLEKSEVIENRYMQYNELFRFWLVLGLVFLLTDFVLRKTLYKSFV
jgi:Ca-activated chloride channel homolog